MLAQGGEKMLRLIQKKSFWWIVLLATRAAVPVEDVCAGVPSHNPSELRVRVREDMGTLDWNYGEVNVEVVLQLMDGLVQADRNGEPVAALAESWKSSADGKTWTFTLRKNALWSDGVPICGQHFVDSFRRVLTKGVSPYAHYYFDLKGAKEFNRGGSDRLGVSAPDCQHVVIELERPISFLPSLVTHFTCLPVRLDVLAQHPKMFTRGEGLVTTGPYVLAKWVDHQRLVLERNAKYYGSRPKVAKIIFYPVADDTTAVSLFDTGKVDLLRDLPTIDRARLSKQKEFRVFPSHIGYYIGFNLKDPDLKDIHLRRALAQSVNLSEIPRFLQAGGEVPADGWYPSYFSAKTGKRVLLFDPQGAREELKQSGFPRGKKLELFYYIKEAHHPLMQWLQQQWKRNLGVDITLNPVEGKMYWATVTQGKYPIFLSGISVFVNSPVPYLTELMSDSHANWTGWTSNAYDSLVQRVLVERDSQKLKELADQAEKIILQDDVVVLPLYFRNNAFLVREPWLHSFWVNPLNYYYVKHW
jgi:oligopeptide transport system substrate-binding protein